MNVIGHTYLDEVMYDPERKGQWGQIHELFQEFVRTLEHQGEKTLRAIVSGIRERIPLNFENGDRSSIERIIGVNPTQRLEEIYLQLSNNSLTI